MKKDRKAYMTKYREAYGETMKEQMGTWWQEHPEYYEQWLKLHPKYHRNWQMKNKTHYTEYQKQWQEQNRERLNAYMREYMRRYRNGKNGNKKVQSFMIPVSNPSDSAGENVKN